MRTILFFAFLAGLSRLFASADPLIADFSQPLAPGCWSAEIEAQSFSKELWADRNGKIIDFNGVSELGIVDTDGLTKSAKGFVFDMRLLWAVDSRNLLEFSLPYVDQEFSAYDPGQSTPNYLNDPTVQRADGSGDMSMAYRRSLINRGPLRLGAGLELSMPTGQGPFASQTPLVATGDGGFVGALAIDAETGVGDWLFWGQGRLPYQLGYEADIAPGTLAGFEPNGTPETLAGGRAWISQAFSYNAVLGMGWDWHVTNKIRDRVAVELQWQQQGALMMDGSPIPDSAQQTLSVVPQARFAFIDGMALNLGWYLPGWYATNQAVSAFGTYVVRVDFTR